MNERIVYEQSCRLTPRIRRITQDNPGLMTGPGTNTYLIGDDPLFVLDPGEDTDRHFDAVVQAVGNASVIGVAPTHAHPDHWPLAGRLARELRAPTIGYKAHGGFEPSRTVVDGERIEGKSWTLQALHTPGHLSDHVSYFLVEEKSLFSGDHVMGWSTSVISRPGGNLNHYLRSLERLLPMEISVIHPAHGAPVVDALARIEELIAHRKMRTTQILEALELGLTSIPEMVRWIYADVDPRLHPVAGQSVLAHLDALVESGRVGVHGRPRDPTRSTYRLVR